MNTDVFISHHTDSSLHIVEAIVNKLEGNKLSLEDSVKEYLFNELIKML